MRAFIALVVVCVTAVMTLSVVTSPASAAGYRACSEPLNLKRQTVHRFRNGDQVLPFGRVIVTPTKEYPDRYCERLDIGDEFLVQAYKRADYERTAGTCNGEMFRLTTGGGPYEVPGYQQGVRVPERACMFQTFSVKWQGKWWRAKVRRQNP